MIITSSKIILNSEEIYNVAVHPYDFDGSDEWCEANKIQYIEDTITNDDYNGDPEHGHIECMCVIKYDNRYWMTSFYYSHMSGIQAIGGGSYYEFTPVKKKELITYEWVKE